MSIGDGEDIGGIGLSGFEPSYVASLGRISGKALSENLQRNGVDLTFRNAPTDADLLYLNVNDMRIGINTDSPVYDLDVNNDILTTDLSITNQATIDNVIINSSGYFSTTTGPLHIMPTGAGTLITFERTTTDNLELNDNFISSFSNSNIVFDPNGSGTVEFQATTNITGDVGISGNVRVDGNLSAATNIIVGDSPLDIVTVVPDFTQSIIPGTDNTYELGKLTKRWSELQARDLSTTTLVSPLAVIISDQIRLDGIANTIFGVQSNEDIRLNPDTGVVYIESTKWQDNTITNLQNTPITFASTGTGYLRFMGNNAFVLPSGTDAERRPAPEVGETRWNTDLNYLECFDGTVWTVSTGGGIEVTQEIMEDLGNVWTLVLG